jgi:uncharacterized phage-associated protein
MEFAYDAERAHNATLWLLKRHGALDHIKVLKLVVLADLEHLARYGRPIVGGEYFAMEHGPVASELYDELKLGTVAGTEAVNSYLLRAVAEPDEDQLSETDLEVLQEINEKFGAWDRYRLSDFTHTLNAWKKNYKGNRGSYRIPYEDLLQERLDGDMLALVRDAQRGELILG